MNPHGQNAFRQGNTMGGQFQQFANLKNYFMSKRIVVTGASSGIGQAVSFWYLNQGASVVLVGKDEACLKGMAKQYPTQATVVVTNITDDY